VVSGRKKLLGFENKSNGVKSIMTIKIEIKAMLFLINFIDV
jgi:hypothetical protein